MRFGILIVALCACGRTDVPEVNCNYKFNAGGLKVCSEGELSPAEVEFAVQATEEQTALRYPQVVGLKETLEHNKVNVWVVDDPLAMNCEELEQGIYRCDKYIGGVNVDGDVIYVRYNSCSAYIPLGHELLHSIEKYYLPDIPHGDHETPWLFMQNYHDNPRDTVEFKIFMELFENVPSCADEWEAYRIGQGL